MAPAGPDGIVYSATYSNVPVYELNVHGNHVMRRRADDWINATHILKVADLDKPARTRVLEKEVQQDIHEKVQGGYGKYQGTWIPQDKAENLAKKYNVYHLLKPILIFKLGAGDKSPPPAPKHTTAASKAKPAKASNPRKAAAPVRRQEYEYDNISEQLHDDDSPDNTTIASESVIGDEYVSRKRKREPDYEAISSAEQEHRMWADAFLDYFMLSQDNVADRSPEIPSTIDINKPIDDEGHTALHWAAAMGDVAVVKELLSRNSKADACNVRGETPLIRAALFANCYDKGIWSTMLRLLESTIMLKDNHNATICHHTAFTSMSATRAQRAKHYLEHLLNRLYESIPQPQFFDFLNTQDRAGDTAFHIAVRNSRRCTKVFQSYGLPTDIPNNNGETVDSYLQQRVKSRRSGGLDSLLQSSSPIQPDALPAPGISPSRFTPTSNLFLPMANYRTSSSKTFNRSLSSLMGTQFADFLQAGEAELADRDNVLADTNRALAKKEAEVSAMRARAFELQAALERDGMGDTAKLEADERRLVAEGERLEEQIQHRALHKLIRQEEDSPITIAAKESDEKLDKAAERKRKLELVRLIDAAQKKRVRLTHEIVDAGADAGMGRKGDLMKGIIIQTMAVKSDTFVEDVEAMVEHMEVEKAGGSPGLDDGLEMMGSSN